MKSILRELLARTPLVQQGPRLRGAAATLEATLQAALQRTPPSTPRSSSARRADAPATEALPRGGRVVDAGHACAAGRRAGRLYVPPQAGAKPLPLVVMLHGCTQSAVDFAIGTGMDAAAAEAGFYVLYPEQSQEANPQRCWSWFKHVHQQRGRGEPEIIAAMTRRVIAEHGVDPARVYVAGLSAGGAMAAIVGNAYPDLYAAIGVHSGLAAGAAGDLPSALASMQSGAAAGRTAPPHGDAARVPTIVFHGDADATVHPRNGEHVAAACSAGARCETVALPTAGGERAATLHVWRDGNSRVLAEHWVVHGAAHAWSGGDARGSYTDPRGPSASAAMLRFFFEHPRAAAR